MSYIRGENGKKIKRLVKRMDRKEQKACTLLLQKRLIEELVLIIDTQGR